MHNPPIVASLNATAGAGSQSSDAIAVPVPVGWVSASHSMLISEGQMIEGHTRSSIETSWLQVLVHPLASVTVTEYVPEEPTVIQLSVPPVLHA